MTEHRANDEQWDAVLAHRDAQGHAGSARLLRFGDPEVAFERQRFLEQQPWRVFSLQVETRVERERSARRLRFTGWLAGFAVALSTAVAALVFFAPQPSPIGDTIRTKGGANLHTDYGASGRVHITSDGAPITAESRLSPGTELQFSVDTVGYDHVYVVGEDADGTLTPYYPDDWGADSLLIGVGKGLHLPDSIELDEAMGKECVLAVFSTEPMSGAEVRTLLSGSVSSIVSRVERECFNKIR